jgi:putative DNA primase/helicase
MDDQHLTLPELARWLHVSERHVQRLLETGDGPPSIRLGRRIIFNRVTVQQWLEARTTGRASPSAKDTLFPQRQFGAGSRQFTNAVSPSIMPTEAIMSARDVAAVLGDARQEGRGWRCRCPLHGGHSLVLRDGDAGRLLVTCWGGCDRLDVLAELCRRGLLDPIDHGRGGAPKRDDDARRIARAYETWHAAFPALPSPIKRYFASRRITLPPPPTLRWAPRCWHGAACRVLPAMLGLVEHVERGIVGIHPTYLRIDGTAKADIPRDWQKRALGPIGGGAVRLGMPQPGAWFAVGEGIETILSVMTACAVPGWAALSAGGLRALILPPEATHVVVCADNDLNGVGQRAAHDAAERWLVEGRRVRLAIPPDAGTDFNDLLCADAPAFTTGGLHVA